MSTKAKTRLNNADSIYVEVHRFQDEFYGTVRVQDAKRRVAFSYSTYAKKMDELNQPLAEAVAAHGYHSAKVELPEAELPVGGMTTARVV